MVPLARCRSPEDINPFSRRCLRNWWQEASFRRRARARGLEARALRMRALPNPKITSVLWLNSRLRRVGVTSEKPLASKFFGVGRLLRGRIAGARWTLGLVCGVVGRAARGRLRNLFLSLVPLEFSEQVSGFSTELDELILSNEPLPLDGSTSRRHRTGRERHGNVDATGYEAPQRCSHRNDTAPPIARPTHRPRDRRSSSAHRPGRTPFEPFH